MELQKIVADLKAERDRLTRAILALEEVEDGSTPVSRAPGRAKRATKAAPRAVRTTTEQARQRFARWRNARPRGSPIPEALWAMAVEVARGHGVNKTAQSLQLNYNALKKRVNAG
ncbi:MAG: hypothetical protein ACRD3O_04580 [Terriglobia bacterium]